MEQKINIGIAILAILLIGGYMYFNTNNRDFQGGAPVNIFQKSILPFADDTYYIGTTSPTNLRYIGNFTDITISGTCTGCPAGTGEANTVSTSTSETSGRLSYWTTTSGTPALLGEVATTSITAGTGLSFTGTLGALVGGSSGTLNAEVQTSDLHNALTLTGTPDYITIDGNQVITRGLIVLTTDVTGLLPASEVSIALGGGSPTVDQMQEYLDNTGSSGFFTGGDLSDGGSGTLNVAAGSGFIRTTNDDNAELQSFKWSASSGIAVADNTTQYVYVDDDGAISLTTNEFAERPDLVKLGVVTDESGVIESTFSLGVRLQESIAEAGRFIRRVLGISRDVRRGGLIFGQSGDVNRDVTMTVGALWWGRTEYTISAFNTAGVDTFDAYILNAKQFTATSTWDNINFDSSGTLTEMSPNRWANLFFYIEPDDHIVMVYGRAEFTSQASAEMEGVPSSGLPSRISETGVLSARFTFQKGANTATIASAFDTVFTAAGVTDHGNLAGLGDDDHTQYLLADATRALTGNWNVGAFTITATTFIGALTGNASTATALSSDPTDCGANTFAISIVANGNLTCTSINNDDWSGTALTVGNGGTGAVSFTDGFVLLGSGTNAITALDVTAKGSILVGDGTGDPVALAVGSNDQVLTADSAQASGLKWAAAGGAGDPFAWTPEADGNATSTTLLFKGGFLSTASSTIDANLTITGIATTTNIIPSADSTSDLGSVNFAFRDMYIDRWFIPNTQSQTNVSITGYDGGSTRNQGITLENTVGYAWLVLKGDAESSGSDSGQISFVSGGGVEQAKISVFGNDMTIQFDDQLTFTESSLSLARFNANAFHPATDSAKDLGTSALFWDETFTDELVLSNDGTGATAANTVRLGGLDLSAGDAGLLITTENDTDHLFASFVGIGTTTPASLLTVAGNFAVGTNGIEFTIDSSGVVTAGTWNGTPIDFSSFTNATGGRSITLNGDAIDADVELYTYGIAVNLFATTTADGISTTTEDFVAVRVPIAGTITGFDCYAVSGTSTIRATVTSNPLSAGTDILYTTGTRCGSQEYIATSTFSQTAVSAGDIIRFYVSDASPTGSRPTIVYPNFEIEKSD